MKLTQIDLHNLGRFEAAPATFRCLRYGLPAKWDYVYTNPRALLRVQSDGAGYLQLDPPGGPAMFCLSKGDTSPPWMTWIVPLDGDAAFTNFWQPRLSADAPGQEPKQYECEFSPEAARYRLRHAGFFVETELWVAPSEPIALMTVTVTNESPKNSRQCGLMPALRPHMAPFSLAPWDKPELFQTCSCFGHRGRPAFLMETRSPSGNPAQRLRAALVTDLDADSFEVSQAHFEGAGTWSSPAAAWDGKLGRRFPARRMPAYGEVSENNAVVGEHGVAALARKVTIRPKGRITFTMVLGALPDTQDGTLPPKSNIDRLARYLKASARMKGQAESRKRYDNLFAARSIQTPDQSLNRYVNEWLPIQLAWVNQLDRGWPTGMRGVRDAAQDATGIVPLDPQAAKIRLLELFSVQRSDGWFPRQYSTQGPDGRHDLRAYVDSGCWVWELLWEYLAQTQDFALLRERLRWLDQRRTAPVLEHVINLFDYYIFPANLGEHGLCKIREGDWNDSVNAAGLEGRGESVMVSCQVVLSLSQCVELLRHCGANRHAAVIRRFLTAGVKLRAALLRHALNRSGYFNAVFNDAGQWIFSPDDPDGRFRINGPANCFAVIAGLLPGASQARVLEALNQLRGPHGWRLFHPPIGSPPIPKLGRIGQGDLAPGVGENGTSYNHGSHGFLGRAAAVAGRGDMLYESLRYMLPYDQEAHPVLRARTAPYAVPNHWKEAIGQDGIGGDTFLSGSISTALRNVYQGLVGFRPELNRLVIDPVIPRNWPELKADLPWGVTTVRLHIRNPHGVQSGVGSAEMDGRPVSDLLARDEVRGRFVLAVPLKRLRRSSTIELEVTLGVGSVCKPLKAFK